MVVPTVTAMTVVVAAISSELPMPRAWRWMLQSLAGSVAGLVLVWVPDLPLIGQIGVAAALASLGTSGLERMFQRLLQGRAA